MCKVYHWSIYNKRRRYMDFSVYHHNITVQLVLIIEIVQYSTTVPVNISIYPWRSTVLASVLVPERILFSRSIYSKSLLVTGTCTLASKLSYSSYRYCVTVKVLIAFPSVLHNISTSYSEYCLFWTIWRKRSWPMLNTLMHQQHFAFCLISN